MVKVKQLQTSDKDGLVTFTGLEARDYVVRELSAPDGYQLSG